MESSPNVVIMRVVSRMKGTDEGQPKSFLASGEMPLRC